MWGSSSLVSNIFLLWMLRTNIFNIFLLYGCFEPNISCQEEQPSLTNHHILNNYIFFFVVLFFQQCMWCTGIGIQGLNTSPYDMRFGGHVHKSGSAGIQQNDVQTGDPKLRPFAFTSVCYGNKDPARRRADPNQPWAIHTQHSGLEMIIARTLILPWDS